MKFLAPSLVAATFALSTAAVAGSAITDIPAQAVVAVPPLAATTWDGLYVGGLYSSYASTNTYPGNADVNDYNLGLFAGYNFQRGALVFGGELAYAAGNYDTSNQAAFKKAARYAVAGYRGDVSVLDLKARVGFALNDAMMVYGFGGITNIAISDSYAEIKGTGLNYGAGVSYQTNNGMLLGLEYIARDLDGSGGADGYSLTADAIEARIGWQF